MINDLNNFNGMDDAIWNFISSVYKAKWDSLNTDRKTNTLRAKISLKFTLRIAPSNNGNKKEFAKPVPVTINKVPLPPPLLAKTKKKVNVISKYFHSKKPTVVNKDQCNNNNSGKYYAQTSKPSINTLEVLKIKETFLSLSAKKIDQVNSIVNGQPKLKPCIKMMTKAPSRKQVIIPMSRKNNSNFMKNSFLHMANINKLLHNTKSEVLVDYIRSNPMGVTIITNKISQQSDMLIIDQYVKSSNDINSLQVEEPHLPKSKSYLKIIGILFYPHENSQERLTSNDIEMILKQNHIFDNISLASKPRVIKISPKSDMSIVWIDIWDVQSGSNAKMLINRCFNVRSVVATTHQNGTCSMLTSAKLSNGLSHSGDYKRTRQGALTILSTIYIHGSWSMLQQYLSWPLSPCLYLMSITHPPCVYLKATMLPTCALTSYL